MAFWANNATLLFFVSFRRHKAIIVGGTL
jgi:hypothetical protein